jgi:hypothetical protein
MRAALRIFGKGITDWQVLPTDAPDFEEAALRACELITARDPRIGKISGHGVYWNQLRRRQANHGNAPSQLRKPEKTVAVVTSGVRVPPSDRGRVADDPRVI